MSRTIKDKVIWITGASSGLGEALAYEAAREGAKLVLSSNEPEKLQGVANCIGLPATHILVVPVDLNAFDADALTQQVIQHFGQIDILINNAGVLQKAFFQETTETIERRIMEINYFSAIRLTRSVLPYIVKNKGIVSAVGSLNGRVGAPWMTTYCASKFAITGFMEALSYELHRSGVLVNLIIPGFMKTDITMNAWTGDGSRYGKNSVTQEIGMPVDRCAKVILRGWKRNRRVQCIGRWEHLFPYIRMGFPRLFHWMFMKMHKL